MLSIDHGRVSLNSSPPNINDVARVTMSLLPALPVATNSLSGPRRITSMQLQISCRSLALLVQFGAIRPTKNSFGRDRLPQANSALPRSESCDMKQEIYIDEHKNLSKGFASETITFVHPVTYISINLYPMYIYVQSQVSNTPGYTTF